MVTNLRALAARMREFALRSRIAAEQDEEFRFHLDMQTQENLHRGMPEHEARRTARIAFGGEQKFREATRDRRGLAALDETLREVALATRRLRRRPGLVGAVVVTLALGIGANTAVFSLIDAVVLRPISAPGADRLVRVYSSTRAVPYAPNTFDAYQELARHASTLDGVAAYWSGSVPLRESDATEDVDAAFVTENYFTVLGVHPALGRAIASGDPSYPGSNPVVVLSGAFWRTHFHGDATVIGRSITLRGVPLTIIGVMPERFVGADLSDVPDLWLPTSLLVTMQMPLLAYQGSINTALPMFSIVGRLRAGADAASRPAAKASVTVIPLAQAATGAGDRAAVMRIVRLLVGVVGLTLLLACLNIANLMLLRAHERGREMGVRIALGANSGRIVQQLMIESVMLAVIGGIAGLGVARLTMRAMSTFTLPGHLELDRVAIGLNARVLAVTCAVTALTAVVSGLVPALRATRTNATDVLRGRTSNAGASHHRLALTSIQVAISLMLLVGGALLLRSMRAGFNTGIGFDPRGIAALSLAPKFDGRAVDNLREFRGVVAEMRQQPGVKAAAAATHVPLARFFARPFGVGYASDSGTSDAQTVGIGVSQISEDYFSVLGVPLLEGRSFGDQDRPGAERVIILNESAARALWPNASAVGRVAHARFFGPVTYSYTVVGVVRDTKYRSLQDDRVPFAYIPLGQEDLMGGAVTFIVRSRDPRGALPMMARAVKDVAPNMKLASGGSPTTRPRLVSDQVTAVLAPQRFGAALLTTLALLALCVSAVGIFGTVSFSVARRTPEIGIRRALGARSTSVIALVVGQTATAVLFGAGAGLVGAAAGARLLGRLLYGVGPLDVTSFVAAVALTAAVAMGAAVVPSIRSVRIDPVRAIQTLG